MTDLARAEQWVRRLADDWEFDEGKHLTTLLAEYDRMRAALRPNCGQGHDVTRISCEDAAAVRAKQSRDRGDES